MHALRTVAILSFICSFGVYWCTVYQDEGVKALFHELELSKFLETFVCVFWRIVGDHDERFLVSNEINLSIINLFVTNFTVLDFYLYLQNPLSLPPENMESVEKI